MKVSTTRFFFSKTPLCIVLQCIVRFKSFSVLRVQLADEVVELGYNLPIHIDDLSVEEKCQQGQSPISMTTRLFLVTRKVFYSRSGTLRATLAESGSAASSPDTSR